MNRAISLRTGLFPTELKVNLTKIYSLNFEVNLHVKRAKHANYIVYYWPNENEMN